MIVLALSENESENGNRKITSYKRRAVSKNLKLFQLINRS